MTEAHWEPPFRLVPGPPAEGAEDFEPRYTLLAQYLTAAADAIIDSGAKTVTRATIQRVAELYLVTDEEADYLLDVLDRQIGLVGPDQNGTRPVLATGRRALALRRKAGAVGYVAAQLDPSPPAPF